MKRLAAALAGLLATLGAGASTAAPARSPSRNLILFVADGLRAQSVTAESAPTMWALAHRGVSFPNSHAVFPTITTVNAAAIATGHWPGDTGEWGNSLYPGYSSQCPRGQGVVGPVVQAENDCVLAELNAHFGGENYLNETSLLAAADARGYATAAVGKLGPTAIQRIGALSGMGGGTVVIDDLTGQTADAPRLTPEVEQALRGAGLLAGAPPAEPARRPQAWFTDAAARVLLPRFKASGRPFVLIYWCRDPDATQHGQNDSPGALVPGINGPSSRAAIGTADQALAGLLAALRAQGLEAKTDVMVTADHGFSTVARSFAVEGGGTATVQAGFVARAVARALSLPLYDTSAMSDPAHARAIDPATAELRGGDALIGDDPAHPDVIVAANSGTDLIWLTGKTAKARAARLAAALQAEPWLGGLFVRDDLGRPLGSLPFSVVNYQGSARTPPPALAVTMRTFVAPGCTLGAELCSVLVPDSTWKTGQGTHGSLGRGETHNFMAAAGPDFRTGYVDPAPVGNADLAPTVARLLGLDLGGKGRLRGRVLTEALVGGAETPFRAEATRSAPGPGGLMMTLDAQTAGGERYIDAAGYPGRVLGLKP